MHGRGGLGHDTEGQIQSDIFFCFFFALIHGTAHVTHQLSQTDTSNKSSETWHCM